jgi:DNA-binding transcriptional LysR family regulator
MLERASLNQLRIFECAARHQHFGRAAAELRLTQPAVSIQLRLLEETVGLALFEQIGRRMHITPAGLELLEHTRAMLTKLREADDAMNLLKGIGGGRLHLAATTTAEYFAPHLLAAFSAAQRKANPKSNIRIRLEVDNREAVVRALSEGTIDLAIMGRAPSEVDTVAVAFAEHPLAIVAAPGHPLAGRKTLPLAKLAGETFIIRERGSGTRLAMEQAFKAAHFTPHETIEFGSNETIKQAVAAGMGLGFISLHTAGLDLAAKRLTVLRIDGMPVMRNWFVVHRAGKKLSAVAAAFKDYLIAHGAARIEASAGRRL